MKKALSGKLVRSRHRVSNRDSMEKFFSFEQELCGKHVRLKDRLSVSEVRLTPTLLYGSGTWTMTGDCERATQRRFVGWMLWAVWKGEAQAADTEEEQ